jgi:dTDP-4-amino-4,6-dideoxygalactose transaminase
MQVCFSDLGYSEGAFPVTERLCKEVLSVPVFPELGEERRSLVVEAVGEFFG